MKWFKHISDSLDDPFIQDLLDEFGSDGYLVFFGTLEILAREFDVKSPGFVTVSRRYFRRKVRLSWHKCSAILKFCEKEGRFFVKDDGRKVEINCPKLKDMCDDWTNRLLRSCSEVAPKKHHIEVEVEVEKNIKDVKKKELFELFWDAFDYKKGRDAAYKKSWLKISNLDNELALKIIDGAKKYNPQKILASGGTPKMAQGWLTDRRWEDEINTEPEKRIVLELMG